MAVNRTTTTLLGVGLLGVVAAVAIVVTGSDDAAQAGDLLVDSETLAGIIDDDEVLVIDARDPEDHALGAIPGAVNVPTDTLNHTVVLDDGTEIPAIVQEPDDIEEPLQQAGISEDTHVVVYDNGAETSATRIFWVLDYYGHDRVSVLDGGIAGWEANGGDLSTTPPEVAAGDFVPDPEPEKHADFAYVQEALHSDSVMLCNALSAESYEEGSIENSTNLHASSLFEDGDVPYFRGDEVVAQMLEDAGHEPGQEFLSFCGRGYMASINYFAGRLLGLEQVRMYDGSLTDWNARDGELLPAGGQA
ncbi:MAG: rhodanese-like domain-containing protein [Nitriliruptoraceae bacterium]